jgi:eukaryotic-like serine/threonine-protein kinase
VHPFAGETPIETMHAIVSDKPRPPAVLRPQLPAGLNDLLLEMLRKEPERRPTAQQVAGRLESLKQGGRKRRWLLAATAVLATTALAVAGSRLYFRPPPEPALRQATNHVAENRIATSAVSPDGSRLAYATADAIFVRSVAGGETTTHSAPADFRVDRISWYPGASAALLLSGASANTQRTALWRLSLEPPGLRLIREDADNGAVSADGSRLAFCSALRTEIWVSGAEGENPVRVLTHESDDFPLLLWTPGGKLAYSRRYWDTSRRVLDSSFETMDADNRRVLSRWDHLLLQSAVYVAGPRLLFLGLKVGDGLAIAELWETEVDPKNGAILRPPRQRTRFSARLAGLSASSAGEAVSVVNTSGNQAVFVGDFDARSRRITSRRRLVLNDHSTYPHAWSPDSQYVVFESFQNNFDLFRQRLDRTFPERLVVSPDAEYMTRLSPDGRWYLYSKALGDQNHAEGKATWVMRIPVEGGAPAEVYKGVPSDEFRCAGFGRRAPGAPPCVLLVREGPESVFYALDPERGKGPELGRITREEGERIYGDWDLSPDGSTAAIPCHQRRHAHVRLLALKAGSATKDVVLAGLTNLNGVTWSADGSGWFVTLVGSLGWRMVYSDLTGRATSLGVRGWAVPSPDGRRIAYLDSALPSNVFLIDRL